MPRTTLLIVLTVVFVASMEFVVGTPPTVARAQLAQFLRYNLSFHVGCVAAALHQFREQNMYQVVCIDACGVAMV